MYQQHHPNQKENKQDIATSNIPTPRVFFGNTKKSFLHVSAKF